MKVERLKLLDALDKLRPGLSPKELIQQMTHYNFMGNHICSYNDLVSIYYPFKTDFRCSVKADSFYNVLSKIQEKDIEIELKDKETAGDEEGSIVKTYFLELTTSSTKAEFPVALEGDLTEALVNLEKELDDGFESLPSDFTEGAYLCMFSASKDPTLGTLTCLYVNGQDIICCDGWRATWYKVETDMQNFMIKAGAAKELRDLKVSSYKIGDSWVHFRNDNGVIANIRRIIGEYRKEIFKEFTPEGTEFLMPTQLKEAIDLCGIVHSDVALMDKQVFLQIANKTATCTAEREGGVRVEKSVPIPFYDGENLAFYMNSEFLNEVIERTPKDESGEQRPSMKLNLPRKRAFFTNEKFDHLFTLSLIEEKAKQ